MTVEQQLRKLPSPYDEMAIKETLRQNNAYYLSMEEPTLWESISGMFLWYNSEMGNDFWRGIYFDAQYHNL